MTPRRRRRPADQPKHPRVVFVGDGFRLETVEGVVLGHFDTRTDALEAIETVGEVRA